MNQFISYCYHLIDGLPIGLYESLLVSLSVGAFLLIKCLGLKNGFHYLVGLLLIEYIFLFICHTIIFRSANLERKYDFMPFWSYNFILDLRLGLLSETIMNVLFFIPIGFMLGVWYKLQNRWLYVFLVALFLSTSVELLQFLFMRGFSELDDVIHNTLGCLIGYGIWRIILHCFSIRCVSLARS